MWKTLAGIRHEMMKHGRSGSGGRSDSNGNRILPTPRPEPDMRQHRRIRAFAGPFQWGMIIMGLWGCSLIDPGQDIPTYLIVDEMRFEPGPDQGTASSNITDLWVYSATDVVGVFPLPAIVPILPLDAAGAPVRLLAGIRENGISNSRAPYPFYTTVEHELEGGPGMRDSLMPSVSLVENVRLLIVEDFENSNVFNSMVGGAGMVRTGTEGEVFEGEKSGRIEVDAGNPVVRVRTVEQEYDLGPEAPVFLEFDYRCDHSFAVGVYGFRDGMETKHLALVINPTEEQGGSTAWNKLYVDLGPSMINQGVADHFELYIECILEGGRDSGSVGLDNLRILTY